MAACERTEPNVTEPATMPDVARFMSEAAETRIDRDGRFILASPTPPADIPIISAGRAIDLARAFLRTYGRFAQGSWADQRGAPVNVRSLEPDTRVLFAETPHERFPDAYHPAGRRHYGPWYLVHFTENGIPVLTVAVSAYATDLSIGGDGQVLQPPLGGEYFKAFAVATDAASGPIRYKPLSPEAAVELVATRGRVRVTKAPRLLKRAGWHPTLALWHVEVDRPLRVRRKGERLEVRDLYVGPSGELHIPVAEHAGVESVTYTSGSPRGRQAAPQSTAALRNRPGMPTEFEPIDLDEEG